MSLVLLVVGTVLVSIALFNKLPRYVPGSVRSARPGALATAHRTRAAPRVRMASARLTEQGKALLAVLGGSALIVAFFLTLSGL
ncbi:hypothetical protein ACFWTE_14735 [Nocardiopsis sp. NPDC058631]|uniref:hypothetical protein n=1 Tax=Nocardiopsis sp. NPDC058631 TaxID=3346566 RepID=UPI00365969ED